MSVEWHIGEPEAPRAPLPPAPPSRARRHALLAVLGVVAAVLAARAMDNAATLRRVEDDVRAVAAAEDAARARGDGEVARLHQTQALRRALRGPVVRAALDGLPPPLPGLEVAGAGEPGDVEVVVERGGKIARAEVQLTYRVTDGELTGTFRASRPMELGEDGRWRHGLPAQADPGDGPEGGDRTITSGAIGVRAPEADAAWLEPAVAEAAAARTAVCRVLRCGALLQEGLTLSLVEAPPGTQRWREASLPAAVLEVASPSHVMAPVDDAAHELLQRAIVRLVLAAELAIEPAELRPSRLDGPISAVLVGLAEAVVASGNAPRDPASWAGSALPEPLGFERLWPWAGPFEAGDDAAEPASSLRRRTAHHLGAYVAREHGRQALIDLVRRLPDHAPTRRWAPSGPMATTPFGWLAAVLGPDAATDVVLNWPYPQSPAPPDVGLVASCLVPDGSGWSRGVPLVAWPEEAPRELSNALCAPPAELVTRPSSRGDRLAGVCVAPRKPDGEDGLALEPGDPAVAILGRDGPAQRVVLSGAPELPIGEARWSADGRRLALVLAEVGPAGVVALEHWTVDAVDDDVPIAHRLARFELSDADWTEIGRYGEPAWQPDGPRLAWVVPGEGGPRVVVDDLERPGEGWLQPGFAPAWSPDGRRVAYVAAIDAGSLVLASADGASGEVLARRVLDATEALGLPRQPRSTATPNADGASSEPLGGGPMDVLVYRLVWDPAGTWVAGLARLRQLRPVALVAWQPETGAGHVASHALLDGQPGEWHAVWEPAQAPGDSLRLFATRSDLFRDVAPQPPWLPEEAPPALALDVATGTTEVLEPGAPALEPIHWPRSPDGRWRVRREESGRLIVEPIAGNGDAWRLNAPGCSAVVEWLGAVGSAWR